MQLQTIYEIIGYLASVLVAVSLMMRSILRLRLINLIGSVLFTIYGLVIGAIPVAAVNFFIVLINIYYLFQIYGAREFFNLLEVAANSSYLRYFLDFHTQEIQKFSPGFHFAPDHEQLIFFILRDIVPAGLFVAERVEPGSLLVQLDYVIPGYRDLKVGRFLYSHKSGIFRARGVERIYTRPGNSIHAKYLRRMGFEPGCALQGEPMYCLGLD